MTKYIYIYIIWYAYPLNKCMFENKDRMRSKYNNI